jgi:hypothetical protein
MFLVLLPANWAGIVEVFVVVVVDLMDSCILFLVPDIILSRLQRYGVCAIQWRRRW